MKKKQIIGIDVSSKKLNLHILETNSDFEIANDAQSFLRFTKDQKLNPKKCVIGAESTSRYHLICQEVSINKGFEFRLLNPILTNKKLPTQLEKRKLIEMTPNSSLN